VPKVIYETSARIARITLNRPEAKNAIDQETHALLWQAWEDFAADDTLDVAILTGAGDAFCAGADLKTFIPPWMDATPVRVRENVATGLGGLTRGLHRTYNRGRARDAADRGADRRGARAARQHGVARRAARAPARGGRDHQS
jgi:enoyl-CoA hydratase/carnithine racemase